MQIGSVFISHSSKRPDYQVTKALTNSLQQVGFDVWWDAERLEGGRIFPAEILEAIIAHHFSIYILSPRSVASTWCYRELHCASEIGKEIVPLLMEEVPFEKRPMELAAKQYVPIGEGVSESLPRILRALGLRKRSMVEIPDDPFARDGRLVSAIANQLNLAKHLRPEEGLNIVTMLKSIGEGCCETDRAKHLFEGMASLSSYSGRYVDYDKVKNNLLKGWQRAGSK